MKELKEIIIILGVYSQIISAKGSNSFTAMSLLIVISLIKSLTSHTPKFTSWEKKDEDINNFIIPMVKDNKVIVSLLILDISSPVNLLPSRRKRFLQYSS